MRTPKLLPRRARTLAAFVAGALLLAAPARADRPKLPPEEEAEVKRVIDAAVRRLKEAQLPAGTWSADSHPAGYAALPALTLLECGVPKNDPVLRRAEAFLRKQLPTMDDTYELSLSILFLDRLGDRNDEKMIQGLALRLVAGQSATGGWGYKCPNLSVEQSHALFKLLHQLAPKEPPPGGKAGPDEPAPAGDSPPPLPPKFVAPAILNRLPVVQDFARLDLQDPDKRQNEPVQPTTDNSDTQFALIALWAAQRHDVPLDRTLWLVANRFRTSQNADGGWGYPYVKGGGAGEGAPMDCCGLLGLAVGHGIARGREPVNAAADKKILDGFAALNKHVGAPVNRMRDIPPPNFYFLWSLERVGVLYDLPTIADKNWYQWGAEAIIANQTPDGDWKDGGYPGATPVANSCLALLFLARTNLVSDLTAALKLNPDDLTKAVAAKVAPPEPTVKTPPPAPPAPTPPPPMPALDDHPAQAPTPAVTPVAMPAASTPPVMAPPPPKAESGGGWIWLILVLVLVVVLALAAGGGGLAFYLHRRNRTAKAIKRGKHKKGGGRPAAKATDASAAKKPPGKKSQRA